MSNDQSDVIVAITNLQKQATKNGLTLERIEALLGRIADALEQDEDSD